MSEASGSTNRSRRTQSPSLSEQPPPDSLASAQAHAADNERLSKQYEGHRKLVASLSTPASSNVCRPEVPHCSSTDFVETNRPNFKRFNSMRNALSYGKSVVSSGSEKFSARAAKFFGLSSQRVTVDGETSIDDSELKWKRRRLRYIHRRYSRFGGYKEDEAQKELGNEGPNENIDVEVELATTPTAFIANIVEPAFEGPTNEATLVSRSVSVDSTAKEKLLRRDSIAKVAWNSFSYFIQRGSTRNALSRHTSKSVVEEERLSSMSFTPLVVKSFKGSINTHQIAATPVSDFSRSTPDTEFFGREGYGSSVASVSSGANKGADDTSNAVEPDLERGFDNEHPGSVLRALSKKIDSSPPSDRPEEVSSLSQSHHGGTRAGDMRHFGLPVTDRPTVKEDSDDEADGFFDVDSVSSEEDNENIISSVQQERPENGDVYAKKEALAQSGPLAYLKTSVQRPTSLHLVGGTCRSAVRLQSDSDATMPLLSYQGAVSTGLPMETSEITHQMKTMERSNIQKTREEPTTPFSGRMQKIKEIFRTRASRPPKSRLHGVGFGLWRKWFQRGLNRVDCETAAKIENFEDHRPFFTYYVTSVQVLVCIVALFFHGFGPAGFDRQELTASVLHTSVVLRQVSIYELENFWIGPKFSDLVRLGAKYSPCMRRDPQIYHQIERERQLESETGCCIYNDGVGCFQASKNECPSLIAVLLKWSKENVGPHGQTSGAVCGQDPNYCQEPLSTPPFLWSENISEWPVCHRRSSNVPEDEKHMHCDITGRPCCILLHGQCRITTKEYCDFVHGVYHPNATLCSQVSCLNEVCGMLPFLHKDHPDQFYRLFLSLFLHAGILHCALTVFLHLYYMRDLEKLIGCGRLALLYMGSGIGGNLASAILMPYKPEVGPSGSLFGVFSAMYADVVYNWRLIAKPWSALKDLSMFTLILFALGALPWIDNWAHIFGFIFGLLISLGTFPYFSFAGYNRRKRVLTVIACWVSVILLFVFFLLRFYKWPVVSWKWTEYINCIPFSDHLCDNQGVKLKTWLNI